VRLHTIAGSYEGLLLNIYGEMPYMFSKRYTRQRVLPDEQMGRVGLLFA
jgi:hypothetical protein